MKRINTIEGSFSDELNKRVSGRLEDLEEKVSSVILDRDDYSHTLGQIAALRWCKEEIRDLADKLL